MEDNEICFRPRARGETEKCRSPAVTTACSIAGKACRRSISEEVCQLLCKGLLKRNFPVHDRIPRSAGCSACRPSAPDHQRARDQRAVLCVWVLRSFGSESVLKLQSIILGHIEELTAIGCPAAYVRSARAVCTPCPIQARQGTSNLPVRITNTLGYTSNTKFQSLPEGRTSCA